MSKSKEWSRLEVLGIAIVALLIANLVWTWQAQKRAEETIEMEKTRMEQMKKQQEDVYTIKTESMQEANRLAEESQKEFDDYKAKEEQKAQEAIQKFTEETGGIEIPKVETRPEKVPNDLSDLRDFDTVASTKNVITESTTQNNKAMNYKEKDCENWKNSNIFDPSPEKRQYIKEHCTQ